MNDSRLNVAVTIDVEEEGLFTGSYCSESVSVTNVNHLWKLDPIFREFGIRPTLLTSYQVAKNHGCKDCLSILKKRWNAEIGAHLHHWNTDPKVSIAYKQPVPSELIPREILKAKTENLVKELVDLSGGRPTTFRMGRFNMGPRMFSVIEEMGFRVDSSIEPLRSEYGGPDHLAAPSDPYYPDSSNPSQAGYSRILEAPITINPVIGKMGFLLAKARSAGLLSDDKIMRFISGVVSITAQPAWVGLNASKAAVIFHKLRGGRFVTIFFHSSELAPGLNPLNPTEEAVQRFLKRLRYFFSWLIIKYDARFIILSEVPAYYKDK